jgi:hypothetical protein
VHHREVHRISNEQAWWLAAGIDPLSVAERLWKRTRGHEGLGEHEEGNRSDPTAAATTKQAQKASAG